MIGLARSKRKKKYESKIEVVTAEMPIVMLIEWMDTFESEKGVL